MSVMMIRAQAKDESVAEVEASAKTWFSAIERVRPKGVRYAVCRLPDSATFVIMLELDQGIDPRSEENPLSAIPEFREFQAGLEGRLAGPPVVEQLSVLGSYNLF